MYLTYLFGITVFILGICWGSFINVAVYRLPRHESVVYGRSHCPSCSHPLSFWDLIPLFSFLFLRGRCRYCGKKIKSSYFGVELLTGILFLLIFFYLNYFIGLTIVASLPCFFFLSIILIFLEIILLTDLAEGIIPNEIILSSTVSWFLFQLVRSNFFSVRDFVFFPSFWDGLFSGLGSFLFFIVIILLTRGRGMGGGDAKLGWILGLWLGFPRILFSLYFSFIWGAVVSLFLVFWGKKSFGQTVPFGPFLVIGGIIFQLIPLVLVQNWSIF